MLDQFMVGNKASYDDFGASVAHRKISMPKKKTIKETVPFSNITYDFSAINGELYWEERELEYECEILADSPEELEFKKAEFSAWVMNVMEEEIRDPYDPEYHFIGTFDAMDYEDDEGMEKTVATVTFSAYPYKIANRITGHGVYVRAGQSATMKVYNKSSHRITPTIYASAAVTLQMGGASYSVLAGEIKDEIFKLAIGLNDITVNNAGTTDADVILKYAEEVF